MVLAEISKIGDAHVRAKRVPTGYSALGVGTIRFGGLDSAIFLFKFAHGLAQL